jgi:uncharacterized membrane protein YraQ (UPF0718 family)
VLVEPLPDSAQRRGFSLHVRDEAAERPRVNKEEIKKLLWLLLPFLAFFAIDFREKFYQNIILEGVLLTQSYVREHTLTCLVPALFISGGIAALVSQVSVIRFFTPAVNRYISYAVASVSGTVLAVCSCTVLPLFSGIYRRGSGLGPAIAFLYSGPAINVLAIVMTARILGWQLGLARVIFSVLFAFVAGLLMQFLFREAEKERLAQLSLTAPGIQKPMYKNVLFFSWMVSILLIATMPKIEAGSLYEVVYINRYIIALVLAAMLAAGSFFLMDHDERVNWMLETWANTKLIVPWLFAGIFLAGLLLGRPGEQGLIPQNYIERAVGGNGFLAVFFAAVAGALMYFATLTEVPILQGLMSAGMGKGPALAMLLSGPALSLPALLALRSIMGLKRTLAYAGIVTLLATAAGYFYGNLF